MSTEVKSKYSTKFIRDFNWYLSVRGLFNFDGREERKVIYDRYGVDARAAFRLFDSMGKIVPTKHPNVLRCLLKTKGSVNLHIKMYAEDRASGLLTLLDLRKMCTEFKAPEWFLKGVENSKLKLYEGSKK